MSTTQGVNRKSTTTEPSGEKITGSSVTPAESGTDPIPAPEQLLSRLSTNNPLDWLSNLAGRIGVPLLRTVLALVYVWFGVLKVIGHSDVYGLVQATVPWFDAHWFMPLLGSIEILIAIGLVVPQLRRLALVGVVGHLAGTFLTFIDAPSWMMHNGNLMLLNMDGEFVLKNLVLISGAVVLLGMTATSSSIRLGGIRLNLRRQPSAGSESVTP
jgi:putative oxidoreductase